MTPRTPKVIPGVLRLIAVRAPPHRWVEDCETRAADLTFVESAPVTAVHCSFEQAMSSSSCLRPGSEKAFRAGANIPDTRGLHRLQKPAIFRERS
jgi:hypothetical protein